MTSVTLASGAVNSSADLALKVNSTTKVLSFNTSGAYGLGSTPAYGTAGQVLTSAGTGATPTWGNDITGNAATATNLAGGAANRIAYQTGAGTSAFLAAPSTSGTVLGWTGSAIDWVAAPAAVSTNNISGGSAGVVVYQTGAGATGFTAAGTSGQILTSTGTTAPVWSSPSAVSLTTGVTGTLPIANGGTNSTATATAGGIGYGTGTAHAYTTAGTSGQVLTSAGAGAPTWGTPATGSMTLVSTLSAVGTNTLSWTGLSGSYTYLLVFNGIGAGGNNDNNQIRVGSGGSVLTSGYIFTGQKNNSTVTTPYSSGGLLAGFYIGGTLSSISNPSGHAYITQTPTALDVNFNASVSDQNGYQAFITGYNSGLTGTITNIQVVEPNRNWTVGSVSLYKLTT